MDSSSTEIGSVVPIPLFEGKSVAATTGTILATSSDLAKTIARSSSAAVTAQMELRCPEAVAAVREFTEKMKGQPQQGDAEESPSTSNDEEGPLLDTGCSSSSRSNTTSDDDDEEEEEVSESSAPTVNNSSTSDLTRRRQRYFGNIFDDELTGKYSSTHGGPLSVVGLASCARRHVGALLATTAAVVGEDGGADLNSTSPNSSNTSAVTPAAAQQPSAVSVVGRGVSKAFTGIRQQLEDDGHFAPLMVVGMVASIIFSKW